MSEEKIYQPKWEEHKERERRHRKERDVFEEIDYGSHHTGKSSKHTNTWGGWMKMNDKQAYYGLMFVVISILAFGAFKLIMLLVHELRAMPMDDPKTEMRVDELDIRKVEKQEALQAGDSIARIYQFDSTTIRRVQTESHHVYRPPRKQKEWYITEREWQDIWRNMKRWKQSQKNDDRLKQEQKEQKE